MAGATSSKHAQLLAQRVGAAAVRWTSSAAWTQGEAGVQALPGSSCCQPSGPGPHLGPHGEAGDVAQHGRRLLQRALLHLRARVGGAGGVEQDLGTAGHAWLLPGMPAEHSRAGWEGAPIRQDSMRPLPLATEPGTSSSVLLPPAHGPLSAGTHRGCPHPLPCAAPGPAPPARLLDKLHAAQVQVLAGVALQHLVGVDGGGLDEGVVQELRQGDGAREAGPAWRAVCSGPDRGWCMARQRAARGPGMRAERT